jgi:hypothetical protein
MISPLYERRRKIAFVIQTTLVLTLAKKLTRRLINARGTTLGPHTAFT